MSLSVDMIVSNLEKVRAAIKYAMPSEPYGSETFRQLGQACLDIDRSINELRLIPLKATNPNVRICFSCGKEFTSETRRKYCSVKCASRATSYYAQKRMAEAFKLSIKPKTCDYCGKIFKPKRLNQPTCGALSCATAHKHKVAQRAYKARKLSLKAAML